METIDVERMFGLGSPRAVGQLGKVTVGGRERERSVKQVCPMSENVDKDKRHERIEGDARQSHYLQTSL